MKTIVRKPIITLAGVSTRTTNAEELGPHGRLPKLWETYLQSDIARSPGVVDPHLIYALYTDYESDANGAYTVLVGHEVDHSLVQADAQLSHADIPESTFLEFITKRGPVYEVVAEAWGEIWEYFKSSPEKRSYTGDFELYDARNLDPANAEVKIYIAIQ